MADPTTMQTCIMEAMVSKEASRAKEAPRAKGDGAVDSFKLVCRRGIGASFAAMLLCSRGGPCLFVVPRVSGEQARRAVLALDPEMARSAVVTTTRELDAWAARAASGGFREGLAVVTDSFYRRLLKRSGGLEFRRAVFDDAHALRIPCCPQPRAGAAWALMGHDVVYGEPGPRGFLGRLLKTDSSKCGNAVWCSECAVTEECETAARMFRSPYGQGVDRRVVAWRPDSPTETACVVLEKAAADPAGASGLVGCVDTRLEGWTGWREGGDRCCPVCLTEPGEHGGPGGPGGLDGGGARLRVRSRCCGKEFCAECLATALVARAERGLPPSCPQCRDCLGACLETCDPLVIDAAGDAVPGARSALAGVKTFEETAEGLVREALGIAGSRVLVVVSPHNAQSMCQAPWMRRACASPGGDIGIERLSGSCRDHHRTLARFEAGDTRVLVVESGPRNEYGVRMPWVTHVVMTDCFSRSSHWVMRTSAAHIDSSLRKRSQGGDGGPPPRPLKVRRMVPARYVLGGAL